MVNPKGVFSFFREGRFANSCLAEIIEAPPKHPELLHRKNCNDHR
jgi:hypothetical protein